MTSPKSKEQVVPEYQADIPEQATEAARAFLRMSPCYPEQFQLVDAFCRAILAERERCAVIAESRYTEENTIKSKAGKTFRSGQVAIYAAQKIAAAIRRPTPPKGGEE